MKEKTKYISETAAFTRSKRLAKAVILITVCLAFCVVITTAVFAAISYARSSTDPVEDAFEAAIVTCQVTEGANGVFTITNTGNVPVYVRVWIDPSWVDSSGKQHWTTPGCNVTYSGWTLNNGFYYYDSAVEPNGSVTITAVSGGDSAPAGYSFDVDVSAEVIQSNPGAAAQEAWGYDFG